MIWWFGLRSKVAVKPILWILTSNLPSTVAFRACCDVLPAEDAWLWPSLSTPGGYKLLVANLAVPTPSGTVSPCELMLWLPVLVKKAQAPSISFSLSWKTQARTCEQILPAIWSVLADGGRAGTPSLNHAFKQASVSPPCAQSNLDVWLLQEGTLWRTSYWALRGFPCGFHWILLPSEELKYFGEFYLEKTCSSSLGGGCGLSCSF